MDSRYLRRLPDLRYGSCHLCGDLLMDEDRCLALVGNCGKDATEYQSLAGPFEPRHYPTGKFLVETTRKKADDRLHVAEPCLCCKAHCEPETSEAIYVHLHCLRLLTRECSIPNGSPVPKPLLDFIWSTAVWRSPWRDTLYLCLDNNRNLPALPSASRLSNLGLSGLERLPTELLYQIRNESFRSLFWRYAEIVDMARRYTATALADSVNLVTVPLSRLSSWVRGREPVLAQEPCDLPTIRLTVDSDGIQSIQRLNHETLYGSYASTPRFDNLAFAVFEAASYPDAKVHFKRGLARLYLPQNVQRPNIWDTPLPPSLEPVKHHPGFGRFNWRFQTADLDKITALTFLLQSGHAVAIHPHTSQEPSASSTVERMVPWVRNPNMWEYVPVSHLKRHVAELHAADYQGPPHAGGRLGYLFTPENTPQPPRRLIWGYHIPALDQVCVIAISAWDAEGPDTVRKVARKQYDLHPGFIVPDSPGRMGSYFEHTAPLRGVARAHVFSDADGYCEGVLLEYRDGNQQALGCCRIGVSKPVITEEPGLLYIRRELDKDSDPGLEMRRLRNMTLSYRFGLAFFTESDPVLEERRKGVGQYWFKMGGHGRLFFHTANYGDLVRAIHVSIKVGVR